jgi:hypothetical protein
MDIQTPNIIGGNLPDKLTATHGFDESVVPEIVD